MPTTISLSAVRAGLAANLATIPGVNVTAYRISNPKPPFVWVIPDPSTLVSYHQAMRNGTEYWYMNVQAVAGANTDIEAQQLLDELVASSGASSVKAAVEADPTLGGACQAAYVVECRNYTEYNLPDGKPLIAVEWLVEIYA